MNHTVGMASLIPQSEIVSVGLSKSSLEKKRQAAKLLSPEAAKHQLSDPVSISPESSTLVLNVLYQYSGLLQKPGMPPDCTNLKSRAAIMGLLTGLRWVYRDAGHVDTWSISVGADGEKVAHGNPLEGNAIIREFRKMHS